DEPEFVASTDSGQTWTRLFVGSQFSGRIDDVVNAYFDSTGALAYVGDRGIQRVVDPLVPNPTLVSKQGNLGNFLFYNVTLDPRDARRGFGVSQDQGKVAQFTGEPMWTYTSTGNEVGKVLIDPHDPAAVYNLAQTTLVTRSTDGGSQWTAANNGIDMSEFPGTPNQGFYNAFALDEHRPSRLVLGGQSVWQTLDSGANWARISQQGLSSAANITAVAIAPSQRETLYAATSDGRFWATFDGGTTNWVERDQGLPVAPGNETRDIAVDPAHPNHVFIQTSGYAPMGRIWMTNDGGSSWTSLDTGIPTNLTVRSLVVDWRSRHSTLYAGTDRGVFFSTDLGANWALFGQGLPRTIVQGLQILPRYHRLVAATFGRGVYQISLAHR
ncbi:MAG: WD40/YVTN/BNR-like repeat-containing protein, partial [Alphaproteobacteria bacterium]